MLVEFDYGKAAKYATSLGLAGGAALMGMGGEQGPPSGRVQQPTSPPAVVRQVEQSKSLDIDMKAIVSIESSGNPRAVNKKSGARGLTQIMKGTWEECVKRMGHSDWTWDDAFDPKKNLAVGTYYANTRIPEMLKTYKIPDNIETRIAAYNWGIGKLNKTYKKYDSKWIEHIPTETKDYIWKYNARTIR